MEIAEFGAQPFGGELFPCLCAAGKQTFDTHYEFQRTLNDVSTRKLIIASLICGLLILVAGTVKLLQTTSDEAATTNILGVGTETSIGDVRIVVNDVKVTGERTLVSITMRSSVPTSPIDGWSMLANGEITEPVGSLDCPEASVEVSCTLEFVVAVGTPTIVFARDGEKRQWLGA